VVWVASYVSADYQQELKRSALPNDYATASKATVEHGDRDVLTVLVRVRVRVRVRLSLSLSLSLTLSLTLTRCCSRGSLCLWTTSARAACNGASSHSSTALR